MSSFQFSRVFLVALLGLFIYSATAQDRIAYRTNGGQVLVPVARQVNSVLQPISVEKPHKVYPVQNSIDIPHRPYGFGFEMNDGNGTTQHRQEVREENGNVKGSYGYEDPAGVYRKVEYYTDSLGYHAKVTSNEPGLSSKNSANVIYVVENQKPEPLVLVPRRITA